jgi:hypothetical protein
LRIVFGYNEIYKIVESQTSKPNHILLVGSVQDSKTKIFKDIQRVQRYSSLLAWKQRAKDEMLDALLKSGPNYLWTNRIMPNAYKGVLLSLYVLLRLYKMVSQVR